MTDQEKIKQQINDLVKDKLSKNEVEVLHMMINNLILDAETEQIKEMSKLIK
jgi:hypothetical protein